MISFLNFGEIKVVVRGGRGVDVSPEHRLPETRPVEGELDDLSWGSRGAPRDADYIDVAPWMYVKYILYKERRLLTFISKAGYGARGTRGQSVLVGVDIFEWTNLYPLIGLVIDRTAFVVHNQDSGWGRHGMPTKEACRKTKERPGREGYAHFACQGRHRIYAYLFSHLIR